MNDDATDDPEIPAPPHPVHRQEKLPWQQPKPAQDDMDAPSGCAG